MITKATTQKVYVNKEHEGTITCPQCEKSKRVNFAKYAGLREALKVKCSCGYLFKIVIEARKYFRKRTHLTGNYVVPGTDKSGSIVVEDLSWSGIRFQTRMQHNLQIGELIDLRFVLDNDIRSEIAKKATVRRVHGRTIGAEFCDLKAYDKELGYYLMPD